jgi:hypothetical protein
VYFIVLLLVVVVVVAETADLDVDVAFQIVQCGQGAFGAAEDHHAVEVRLVPSSTG